VDVAALVDEGLGNSAYVVDLGDGGALVVDPARDPRPYLAELDRRGLVARFVVETHLHADFVSGGGELAARGARLLAPAGSDLAHDHHRLDDGDEVDLGGVRLKAIATPGHTPEHLAYLLLDGDRPLALFSGGTLLAGGVARTDLLTPEETEPLARAAYRSITTRLLTLPDDLAVYPTHGGGSFCSVAPGGQRTTTIGRERTANPLLVGAPDEDTFVSRLFAGFGSYPPYFLELRDVNRAGVAVHQSLINILP
jgi:glyoxylase-like metal-dependent hydrolase (beta-lactamase superfamily II)